MIEARSPGRLAALFRKLERLRSLELRTVTDAIKEASAEETREREHGTELMQADRRLMLHGDQTERTLMAVDQRLSARRLENWREYRTGLEREQQHRHAVYRSSRLESEQMKQLAAEAAARAQQERVLREQIASLDRHAALLHWTSLEQE